MSRVRRPDRYDSVGRSYRLTRRPDPRLAASIYAALAGARTVVNVAAGTGSYEPDWLEVTAIESGTWDARYGHLRGRTELDCGHRLIIADLLPAASDSSGSPGALTPA